MLPNHLFELGLSKGSIATYAYLLRCENRKTFTCFPSYADIGKHIGVKSKTTIAAYVRELEEKGLVCTEQRVTGKSNGKVQNSSLLYHILPFETAWAQHMGEQMSLLEQASAAEKARQKWEKKHGQTLESYLDLDSSLPF